MRMYPFFAAVSLFALAKAVPQASSSSDCVGTISSLADVSTAVQCKTVDINAFTVPAGQTFSLNLLDGATVNVGGDITFSNKSWAGPLFEVTGKDITFNGNGKRWDGGGPFYWDGHGLSGGVTKPDPMMSIQMSGMLSGVHVVNSPARCFALNNNGPLVVSDVIVDDGQGNYPNDKSNGVPAGRNTDGFDVSGNDLVIENSAVINQDDCLAINRGQNISFENNYCNGGHGISIGSIGSNTVVEKVMIRGNNVVNSMQAFRIKTDRYATNSWVTDVSYSDNTAQNCTLYGVTIDQSYPDRLGTPGNGVTISGIDFSPATTNIQVSGNGQNIAINCGEGSCIGAWHWEGLKMNGGGPGKINNRPSITGYAL